MKYSQFLVCFSGEFSGLRGSSSWTDDTLIITSKLLMVKSLEWDVVPAYPHIIPCHAVIKIRISCVTHNDLTSDRVRHSVKNTWVHRSSIILNCSSAHHTPQHVIYNVHIYVYLNKDWVMVVTVKHSTAHWISTHIAQILLTSFHFWPGTIQF